MKGWQTRISALAFRERIWLCLLLAVVCFFSYMTLFYDPVMKQASSCKEQITQLEKLEEVAVFKEEETTRQTGKDVLELHKVEKNSAIAYNVMGVTGKAGMRMESLEIGDAVAFKQEPPICFVPLALSVIGDMDRTVKLVNLLEQDSFVEIQSLDMEQAGNAVGTSPAFGTAIALKIRFYYFGVD